MKHILIECTKHNYTRKLFYHIYQPLARVGYDTRSVFKRCLTGLNSEFSFLTSCLTKGICLKVNVIARLEYELAYYDSAVHRFNHYTTKTPPAHPIYLSIYLVCMYMYNTKATRHFLEVQCLTKVEEPSLSYYLPIAGGRIIGFIPFPRVLVLCEMQSVSSRI